MTFARPKKKLVRNTIKAWALLSPTVFFMGLFTFYPFINNFRLSFFKSNLATKGNEIFNGLKNYTRAFNDRVFLLSIENTLRFCAVVIPVSLILGLLLACLLNSKTPGRTFFRAMVFYPNISPMVGFYLIWMFLLASDIGYINRIFGVIGLPTHNWLGDSKTSLYSVAAVYIWKHVGYYMLFYLSGLQNIDESYYEAAMLDGATEWQKFRHITFPLLMPTTVFTVTLAITNAVQVVDPIAILTKGGPNNSSMMVMYHIYTQTFTDFNYGMAATYSVLLMVVLLVIICFQNFGMDRKTHYEN